MQHSNSVGYLNSIASSISAVEGAGLNFVQSETNSISCQGLDVASGSFGSAIWTLDWGLLFATRGAKWINLHTGSSYRYAPFQPIKVNDTDPFVRPNYAALLAIQETIGAPGTSPVIAELPVSSGAASLAAYGVWENNEPKRITLINTAIYNQTSSDVAPPTTNFTISLPRNANSSVSVKRLTAPGADVLSGALFGGQSWEDGCVPSGEADVEQYTASDGKVTVPVRSSEAVVVSF